MFFSCISSSIIDLFISRTFMSFCCVLETAWCWGPYVNKKCQLSVIVIRGKHKVLWDSDLRNTPNQSREVGKASQKA